MIKPIRLIAFQIGSLEYWIATNGFDLTAEDRVMAYRLRWEIKKLFASWKRHLKVYHLISRCDYGSMVQILSELITYLLLGIYCRENFNERVSIQRVRQLNSNSKRISRCWRCGSPEKNIHSYFAVKI